MMTSLMLSFLVISDPFYNPCSFNNILIIIYVMCKALMWAHLFINWYQLSEQQFYLNYVIWITKMLCKTVLRDNKIECEYVQLLWRRQLDLLWLKRLRVHNMVFRLRPLWGTVWPPMTNTRMKKKKLWKK